RDVVLQLRRDGRELALRPRMETAELAEVGRVGENLVARAVSRLVVLALALAEERRELFRRLVPLEDLVHVRADLPVEQELPRLVVGDDPEPFLREDLLDALLLAVVAVE